MSTATLTAPAPLRPATTRARGVSLWPVWTVLLVAGLYAPTLGTRFDFIDDGNLVYPAAPMSVAERLQLVWDKIEANYLDLGPFRPLLWVHWEIQAELFQGDPLAWRCLRWLWTAWASAMLLWLLRELGMRRLAAAVTTALAMWNPFRGEIWTSLTLAEGVAMPYAILGLVCAIRGARSARPWAWDVGGLLCLLAALGCKNTFAAVVPAQVFLRLAPDGRHLALAWRLRGRRACWLAITLILPIVHYIVFKLNARPGNYEAGHLSWEQLVNMLDVIQGTLSFDFMAPGFVLALIVVTGAGRLRDVWDNYRAACIVGVLLLLCGLGIYLPMPPFVAGRYSMPAVWGADILIAALLSTLTVVSTSACKRLAAGALACGLVGLMAANVGRQQKLSARSDMLWQAVEYVERNAPQGAVIDWVGSEQLNVEEGIHFQWHLAARGRSDIQLRLVDASANEIDRREIRRASAVPVWRIVGGQTPVGTGEVLHTFATSYHLGGKHFDCYLTHR
jgi:hypothetical protein